MEQPQERKNGRKTLLVVVVAAVAAILLLSALAAFYHSQAMDYRDAKYKAQYVLVQDILGTIPMAEENITDAVDDLLDNGWRRSAAMTASALAAGLSEASHSIQVMYPGGDGRNTVFGNLSAAFAALSQGAYEAYVELSSEVGPLEEHDLGAETDADLRAALASLDEVSAQVAEGVDPAVDWTTDPYDLLDGMDLDALDAAAAALSATFA
ncbi:MAG: hypothetical protein AB1793_08785 [Candidatus Thermoplasmatota archaeon]